jgi:hypothetical protein
MPTNPAIKQGYEACMILASEKYNISNSDFETAWKVGRDIVHQDLQGASHSRLLYAQKASEILFSKTNPQFALEIEKTYWGTFLN